MTPETNVRTGLLSDAQYASVLKELPSELKPLFAVGYATGIRLGELKAARGDQVDLEAGFITLENGETKNGEGRIVPVLEGDMSDLLSAAKKRNGMKAGRIRRGCSIAGDHRHALKFPTTASTFLVATGERPTLAHLRAQSQKLRPSHF
jgi:integrase